MIMNKLLASNYTNIFSSDNFNITSLMNAVAQDDFKATEVFLKSGANVNESNLAKVTPLHIAAKNNSFRSMSILIDYKANINAVDFEGWTPLMRACLNKNEESVKILINSGANLWKKNVFGETALIHSVMSNCIECLNLIKNNYKNQSYDKDVVIAEINKSLVMTYKKENKDMETILNIFYDDVTDKNLTNKEIEEREDKQKELENNIKRKQKEAEKQQKKREKELKKRMKELDDVDIKDYEKERLIINDQDVKKEMEYIIKKIYIFQGEVRYL